MISTTGLVLRTLRHTWRVQVAVAAAAAVGVAVLAGALLVGDSVRASLRHLALERIGRVESAVVGQTYFREKVATAFGGAAPAIVMNGAAEHADSGARSAKVHIYGVDGRFWELGGEAQAWAGVDTFSCVLNAALAEELGAKVGDDVLTRVQMPDDVARESWLGERDNTVATMRLTVAKVLPQAGLARFALRPTQKRTLNAFVPLRALQQTIERTDRINAVLIPKIDGATTGTLKQTLAFEDYPLRLHTTEGGDLSFESGRVFLSASEVRAAREAAKDSGAVAQVALAYMANWISCDGRRTPYSSVVGHGGNAPQAGKILLDQWTANDLAAKPGDSVSLTYFVDDPAGKLTEATTTFTLEGVMAMDDPRGARAWIPAFPGIAEATTMANWKAPFPLDLRRIRDKDEAFWDTYRAKPKAVIALDDARRIWGTRYGQTSSVRVSGVSQSAFRERLMTALDPSDEGIALEPVRTMALASSSGTSDFGGLFLGFSLFLIVSAAMLIQILFRLGVEMRARQLGLLGAVGFTHRRLHLMMLTEGGIVAAVGGAIGVAVAVAYGRLLVYGLNHWWVGAIGRAFLELDVTARALVGGFAGGWVVAMLSILAAARKVSKAPPRRLLTGNVEESDLARRLRRRFWMRTLVVLIVSDATAAGLAFLQPPDLEGGLFYVLGACLLATVVAAFALFLASGGASGAVATSLTRLGLSGARRRPTRSLLVVGLMATAAFLVVAVGANRHSSDQEFGRDSGTGGFTLIAETSMPIYSRLDPEILGAAQAFPLRLRPGANASCQNLYQASAPRVIAVSDAFIHRGGFTFASSEADDEASRQNPWLLLREQRTDGAIPAIGDYTTVKWLLHKGLGREIEVGGKRLRIVAMLRNSIFQSGLIVGEAAFERAWPENSGWRVFAIESERDRTDALGLSLEARYGDTGFDAVRTDEMLAALKRVENTYLSTFQALGGLGLLLGTAGLALAMTRNLIERRSEFALLSALGFRFGKVWWLAVSENLFLLLIGLVSGTICALIAVAPALSARAIRPPWPSLSGVIAAVLAFGFVAAAVCAAAVLHAPEMETLKRED